MSKKVIGYVVLLGVVVWIVASRITAPDTSSRVQPEQQVEYQQQQDKIEHEASHSVQQY